MFDILFSAEKEAQEAIENGPQAAGDGTTETNGDAAENGGQNSEEDEAAPSQPLTVCVAIRRQRSMQISS